MSTAVKDKDTPTISINMDTPCSKCSEKGAAQNGLCLSCVTARITGGHLTVPEAEMFDSEFLPSQEMEELAAEVIGGFEELNFIEAHELRIVYLWKAKGGSAGGKNKLGQCQKPTGLLRYFSHADFVVWLAADHLFGRPRFNFKRLLYHELKHIGVDDKGNFVVVKHDFEGFVSEVERFGVWDEGVKPMASAFQQHLFNEE